MLKYIYVYKTDVYKSQFYHSLHILYDNIQRLLMLSFINCILIS